MGRDPYAGCNFEIDPAVTPCTLDTCCLAQSPFLYIPVYSGNLFFIVFFALFIIPQLFMGIKFKTTGYAIGMIVGLVLEAVGYAGRIMLHDNPFDANGFLIYLICLTIAPVFISAAIYLSIARIIELYGQHLSYLKPKTLAIIFICSDTLSLVLQAAGGGIADSFTGSMQRTGIDIMVAGLFLQAISLLVFLGYLFIFALRARSGRLDMDADKVSARNKTMFKVFLASLILATVLILIRSIFRVAELWEGFSGKLWNDELDFMVLDGAMIALAVVLLTAFHPGPAFGHHWHARKNAKKAAKNGTKLETRSSASSSYISAPQPSQQYPQQYSQYQ